MAGTWERRGYPIAPIEFLFAFLGARRHHFVAFVDQLKGKCERLLIAQMHRHPPVTAHIRCDLDVWVLNQRRLLVNGAFDRDDRSLGSDKAEYLALGTDLEHRIAPRMILER